MSLAVDRILERRARRESRRPEAVSLAAAAALHGIALALVLVLPRLNPPPPPPSFVPVQIIPAQALGVRHPAPRPKAEKPAPPKPEPAEEPEPAPEPPKPKPEPERPAPKPVKEEVPSLPEKPDKKKPEKPKPEKPRPATAGTGNNPAGTAQQGEANGEAGRKGAPTGNPLGTTAFGSQIAGLDNPDFKFGYYIDQLLSAIDSKWVRPPLGNDVKAIISFRIQKDGSLTDLQVAQSSGYNSFDLAALRAVQNASPFAPLPRAYRNDSLGVTLIVR
ncbi:MAG TPA: TonB family protein [Thermoanaerobaculia bacterium]|nr:TonB family protein [Thermoanaerobaculia bacterium]